MLCNQLLWLEQLSTLGFELNAISLRGETLVYYYYFQAARRAIEVGEDVYSPAPFYEWVQDQYLTARDVKVTKVEI